MQIGDTIVIEGVWFDLFLTNYSDPFFYEERIMTKISGKAQHLPITNDNYKKEDFNAVPGKVAEVVSHEPTHMQKAWDKAASDGFISRSDAQDINRAMGDWSIFGREVRDGTDTVEAKFMAARLANSKVSMDPEVRKGFEAELSARQARMENGEVLSGTFQYGDSIHELTEGVVDMPFDEFMAKMPADRWGVNLASYRGGEVKVTERDDQGNVTLQRERMVTETPLSKLLPGVFEANDMTKVESIHRDENSVTVKWEVLDSDNKTTLKDIGEIRFIRMGDKTKIEFESEHRVDTFPGMLGLLERHSMEGPYNQMTGKVMRDFFSSCIEQYQGIAKGDIPVQ